MIRLSTLRTVSLLPFLLAIGVIAQPPRQGLDGGHQYFVDCSSPNNGSGNSTASPWNSLEALHAHTFLPGDVIHMRRGTACRGSLELSGSGSADHPVRLTAYGEGPRPRIIAGSNVPQAFKLFNQEYWDVDSLDISGGNTFGVLVSGDKGILHHIHLTNLAVHDVFGGPLKHKESGLVVISPGTVNQRFDDVLVDGVTAFNTNQWVGIVVGGGNFGFPPESTWSTNVTIRNSIVHDVQGDGIVLFRIRKGLIDSSVAWRTGMQETETTGTPNAIWTWMCHDCVVSHSEAFLTDSPGVDGGAFDIDYGNTNNSVLDSFGHDTTGYCVAVFGAGFVTHQSIVRGNVCIDNGRSPRMAAYQGAIFLLTWNGGVIDDVSVDHNTVYWDPPGANPAVINDATIRGAATFTNNTIYSTSPLFTTSNSALAFSANHYFYYGIQPPHWKYGGVDLTSFAGYQHGSHEDADSHYAEVRSTDGTPKWFGTFSVAAHSDGLAVRFSPIATDILGKVDALHAAPGQWRINCLIPAALDSDGLLNPGLRQQLTILKSLSLQYPVSRLKIVVGLAGYPTGPAANEMRTALEDMGMHGVTFIPVAEGTGVKSPHISLFSPDGTPQAGWTDFAGPTQIGFAVRKALGTPDYPQAETSEVE